MYWNLTILKKALGLQIISINFSVNNFKLFLLNLDFFRVKYHLILNLSFCLILVDHILYFDQTVIP